MEHLLWNNCESTDETDHRDNFLNVPSQWEMRLQCNVVSHWVGTYTKWSPDYYTVQYNTTLSKVADRLKLNSWMSILEKLTMLLWDLTCVFFVCLQVRTFVITLMWKDGDAKSGRTFFLDISHMFVVFLGTRVFLLSKVLIMSVWFINLYIECHQQHRRNGMIALWPWKTHTVIPLIWDEPL